MSDTKPTAGALRAARTLLTQGVFVWPNTHAIRFFVDDDLKEAAYIIDREMGGPQVEELLQVLLHEDDWHKHNLIAKAREVEAALGGKQNE